MKFKKIIKHLEAQKKPLLAVLIDPDKFDPELIRISKGTNVSCFLVGGSELHSGDSEQTILAIKKLSDLPVILFPGNEKQLSAKADGLLLLSLLSGRNADYLIGKHVAAAPLIKKMKLKFIPTAYLLLGRGSKSATEAVTKTKPLDLKTPEIIKHTALAAEQLGFRAIYLEAGSGSQNIIPAEIIRDIKKEITLPIIVGGGVDTASKARTLIKAGANMVVVGNALEKNVYLLSEISACFN